MNIDYIPTFGDLVFIDFDPARGVEIKKRRPAVVVSIKGYSQVTPLCVVVPITSAKNNNFRKNGYLVQLENYKVSGWINPLQIYSFDYRNRKIEKVDQLRAVELAKVLDILSQIIPFDRLD